MSRDWTRRAACADEDPELFFPTAASGSSFEAQVAAAKAVCGGCPVRAACLVEALERLPYGIAGGLTEDERRAVRGGRLPTDAERAAKEGRRLLALGDSAQQVAKRCGVSERTAYRWAAAARSGREVA